MFEINSKFQQPLEDSDDTSQGSTIATNFGARTFCVDFFFAPELDSERGHTPGRKTLKADNWSQKTGHKRLTTKGRPQKTVDGRAVEKRVGNSCTYKLLSSKICQHPSWSSGNKPVGIGLWQGGSSGGADRVHMSIHMSNICQHTRQVARWVRWGTQMHTCTCPQQGGW